MATKDRTSTTKRLEEELSQAYEERAVTEGDLAALIAEFHYDLHEAVTRLDRIATALENMVVKGRNTR